MSFSWRERFDKRLTPFLMADEFWTIPSSAPKTLLLYEIPAQCCFGAGCGVCLCNHLGCPFTEVLGAPSTPLQFKTDYDSGLICLHASAPNMVVNPVYYGCGSLIWARDVNELGTEAYNLDITKISRDGTIPMCAALNMGGFNISSVCCLSGVDIVKHTHTGLTGMGCKLNAGLSITAGTITGNLLAADAISAGLIANCSVDHTKLVPDPVSLACVTCSFLQTNANTLGIDRTPLSSALVTFDSVDNTIPKMMFYNDGSVCIGVGACCSGALNRTLQFFMQCSGTTIPSIEFSAGTFGGASMLLYMCPGKVQMGSSALYVDTTNDRVSVGSGAATTEKLNVAGNMLLNNGGILKIKNSGGVASCVFSAYNGYISIGYDAPATYFYASSSVKAYIDTAGFHGVDSVWSGDVRVGGTSTGHERLFVQSSYPYSGTVEPVLKVRDCLGNPLFTVDTRGWIVMGGSTQETAGHPLDVIGAIRSQTNICSFGNLEAVGCVCGGPGMFTSVAVTGGNITAPYMCATQSLIVPTRSATPSPLYKGDIWVV